MFCTFQIANSKKHEEPSALGFTFSMDCAVAFDRDRMGCRSRSRLGEIPWFQAGPRGARTRRPTDGGFERSIWDGQVWSLYALAVSAVRDHDRLENSSGEIGSFQRAWWISGQEKVFDVEAKVAEAGVGISGVTVELECVDGLPSSGRLGEPANVPVVAEHQDGAFRAV